MRKLLLALGGSFITDGQYELFDKPRDKVRWAYVIIAGKSVPDDSYLQKHRNRVKELGWDV